MLEYLYLITVILHNTSLNVTDSVYVDIEYNFNTLDKTDYKLIYLSLNVQWKYRLSL